MNPPQDQSASQKLIRCVVESKKNIESLRFIELEHYKLWTYMMLHKHGLRIKESSLWLWVKDSDLEDRKEHYSHFPVVEKVNKIELFVFDEIYGFTQTTHRFVSLSETNLLEKVLISHISPEIADSGNYDMKTYAGTCFQSGKTTKKMVLGLSDKDDRIWFRRH